ncbi:MAG TPA: ABC transporter permease [Longimicrobiales bacterium]|jgi:ABC-2 type transport system permease protein|nr:ABC transporter permease [Longimicrobiales bacterium]
MDPVRLMAMARKEWIQLRRDPRSMILAFVLPLFLILFFGYAITWDVDDIRLAVLDQDRSRESLRLVEAFEASGYFSVQERLRAYPEAEDRLASGSVLAVLVIPPRFQQDLTAGRAAPLQLLLDGSDANTATIALNYADAIVARRSAQVLLQGRELRLPLRPETRVWYNPTLESRNMIVPGLVAVIMSIIAAMLTALTIAREWERGTMEQLASTPVGRVEVVVGKLLPYLLIGLFDVAVVTVAGMVFFGTPLEGSVPLLTVMTLLFLVGALGVGIFISAVVKSQVLATQVAMILTYLPALLLSGFLFDIHSMPAVLQAFTFLVPARYYITVTRGIFLKGVGVAALWPEALFMVAFAVLGLGAATLVFRKELE